MRKRVYETWESNHLSFTINLQHSQVESVKKKDIQKSCVRVYDGNHIGIAASLDPLAGRDDEEKRLKLKAEESLGMNVPYPCEPTASIQRKHSHHSNISDHEVFYSQIQNLLERLRAQNPDFGFSGLIEWVTEEIHLKNDTGLNLHDRYDQHSTVIIFKENTSTDLYDGYMITQGSQWNPQVIGDVCSQICQGFHNLLPLPTGKQPVIVMTSERLFLSLMAKELRAEAMGTGSSLFSGVVGEKRFHPDFSLFHSRRIEDGTMEPFFDSEGVTLDEDRIALIHSGRIVTPYSDKRSAKKYGYALTATAGGKYDDIPHIVDPHLQIQPTAPSLDALLEGKKGILILGCGGGSFSPDGSFAAPVHTAFLHDGHDIIGKLPPLSVRSNVWDMFGKDYKGTLDGYLRAPWGRHPSVIEMEVVSGE